MQRLVPTALLLLLCGAAAARQSTSRIITCTVDGKVTYTSEPCINGSIGKVLDAAPASAPALQEEEQADPQLTQALEERRAFVERMRHERARRRSQDEAAREAEREAAATAAQCAKTRTKNETPTRACPH